MRKTICTCNGCRKQVDCNELQDFIFVTQLTTGKRADGVDCLSDRCITCSKPIYKALNKIYREFKK